MNQLKPWFALPNFGHMLILIKLLDNTHILIAPSWPGAGVIKHIHFAKLYSHTQATAIPVFG